MSLTEESALKEIRKYLNKLSLNEEKHSFLIKYKEELNYTIKNEPYNKVKINDLHRSLFIHRNEIIKEKSSQSL